MANTTAKSDKLAHLSACIVRVAENRDKAAFAELFDHYAPLIRAYSLAREPGADLVADDLVQEVLARVWLKAAKYNARLAHETVASITCDAIAVTQLKLIQPTSSMKSKTRARGHFKWCSKVESSKASEQDWNNCQKNNLKY
jgi:hypothetical protein